MNLTSRQLAEVRELRKTIGARIHYLRVQHRETLHHLSHASGISIEKLDQYELGKGEISIETLVVLAHVLDLKITSFFATVS
jgi:transcriptional regulator with XRE-family HTH domain